MSIKKDMRNSSENSTVLVYQFIAVLAKVVAKR